MRVKVADTWYSSEDASICVELNDQDKHNLSNMPAHCTRYAQFHVDTRMTEREMREVDGEPRGDHHTGG